MLNKDYQGLHEAAFILALSAFGSQILALLRDRLFASKFGASETLDIYYSAFRIPDLIYVFIASLVATTVLIPFVVSRLEEDTKDKLRLFVNTILTFYVSLHILVASVIFFLIPYLKDLIVPGFGVEAQDSFILLSRILLLQPLFIGVATLLGSINQAMRRFMIYALAPIAYNVGIIIGVAFLYDIFGSVGLVYGVLIGAALQFIIQIPTVWMGGVRPTLTTSINFSEIKDVLYLSIPRTVTLGAHHVIIIIFTALASLVGDGAISIFNFSYNLQSVPLAIIGVSYSVAAFPTLSKLFIEGEKEVFVRHIVTAGRHIIFWSLPVLALFIVLRAQIVRSIFGVGEFDWTDTRLTAAALALFSISVVAQGLILLFVRGYYASGNTRKPLLLSIVSAVITIILGYALLNYFESSLLFQNFFENLFKVENLPGTKILMLPLAFSVGALLNLTFLWISFKIDFKTHYTSIRRGVFEAALGALLIGFVAHRLLRIFDDVFVLETFMGIFSQGFLAGLGGLFIGALFFEMIHNREYREMRKALTRKILKKKPLQPEPSEF